MGEILMMAIKASINAGSHIMKIYESEDFSVERKDDDSPLTSADLKSNAVINSYLDVTDIPIFSEENKQLSFEKRKAWELCWIVDPLDGTKEFIKQNGEFTVNIALIRDSLPILGVIYVPAKKIIYYADEKNAWKQTLDEIDPEKFDHSKSSAIQPGKIRGKIRVVGSRSHMSAETENFIAKLSAEFDQEIEVISRGSSLKFCLVAEGAADVYPRLAPTMEWDTAAGHAICKAKGLKVMDKITQKEMRYNKPQLLNNNFLVSNLALNL